MPIKTSLIEADIVKTDELQPITAGQPIKLPEVEIDVIDGGTF